MNILIVDAEGCLSEKQKRYAKNRLYHALLRFEHRINGATMHMAFDPASEYVKCVINVNIEGSGIVSTRRANVSSEAVVNLAVDAVEPKIAFRVDWHAWFNADTFATWLTALSHTWSHRIGFSKRWGARNKAVLARPFRSERFNRHQYSSGG